MKFKYLIRDRRFTDSYLQNDSFGACYSSDIGTAIFDKLPKHISERGDCRTEFIRSDNSLFIEILEKELSGNCNVMGLKAQISDLEWKLGIMKRNRNLIIDALNFAELFSICEENKN